MEPLVNPEEEWQAPEETDAVDRRAIVDRIGEFDEPWEVLGGGLANANVRIGGDRLLRIYRRDVEAKAKEAVLLGGGWETFRVPAVLEEGSDYLLLEYVEHGPLVGSAEHGAAMGRALAEIHETSFEEAGFLGPDAETVEPFGDFVEAFRTHMLSHTHAPGDVLEEAVARFDELATDLEALADDPVLLHGDFKVSNLHGTPDGEPLVLDWEFAYAGPALLDVGQLMRWGPPGAFCDGFAAAYRQAGGQLPVEWRRLAETFDLVNLVGLLEGAEEGSRRFEDVRRRVGETIEGVG